VNANAIARCDVNDFSADTFDAPGHFVPERQRQRIDLGNAGAIMRVRVTNPASCNPNENIRRTDLWNCNFRLFQRFSDLRELDSPHRCLTM
jgi:hypothetical protein